MTPPNTREELLAEFDELFPAADNRIRGFFVGGLRRAERAVWEQVRDMSADGYSMHPSDITHWAAENGHNLHPKKSR